MGGAVVAIGVFLAMVVVIVLDEGNGAHRYAGLFAFDGAKYPMFSLLCSLLLWDLSLDLLVGESFLINLNGYGKRGFCHPSSPPQMPQFSFLGMEMGLSACFRGWR